MVDGQCCVEKRDEAEEHKGSRLGHCTGFLLIDVAANATSVHAWRETTGTAAGGSSGRGGKNREGKRRYSVSKKGEVAKHFLYKNLQRYDEMTPVE